MIYFCFESKSDLITVRLNAEG